jgi:two-component system chemotaxis sensor kinase CheA
VVRRDIRVDLERLDSLVNLVGELVIAEAMVTRNNDLAGLELENFERAAHHLRRIICDIQDVAMAVRMIPLSATFRKMIRLVHDLSEKQEKNVRLELVGEETEVDKTVIELIADPLVHIVRNSVDHGIEKTAERRSSGKDEQGLLSIEARHEGGEVLILVRDDGRGLSREKLLTKGIERGLVTGDGADLSDNQVFQLIFEPGLSTASAVTDVSGRGVGMDVVKRNIEKLKGRIDIRSTPNEGTSIILRLPLTLAIMEGMLIRVGSARYTIPILTIRETFQPDPKQITVTMDGQEMVKVRREIIPVVRLHELFRKEPDHHELHDGILIIVEYNRKRLALLVDDILGQYQTVIKALPDYLESVPGLSGCTILGDGEVSLILDVAGIMHRVGKAL